MFFFCSQFLKQKKPFIIVVFGIYLSIIYLSIIYLFILCLHLCLYVYEIEITCLLVYMCLNVSPHAYTGQTITCESLWVPETKLRSAVLLLSTLPLHTTLWQDKVKMIHKVWHPSLFRLLYEEDWWLIQIVSFVKLLSKIGLLEFNIWADILEQLFNDSSCQLFSLYCLVIQDKNC